MIFTALDEGVNLIDTANIYSHGNSEEIIGRSLVDRRDEALIATKFGLLWEDGPHGKGGSRKHIVDALGQQLLGDRLRGAQHFQTARNIPTLTPSGADSGQFRRIVHAKPTPPYRYAIATLHVTIDETGRKLLTRRVMGMHRQPQLFEIVRTLGRAGRFSG